VSGSRLAAGRALWLALLVAFLGTLAGVVSAQDSAPEVEVLPTEAIGDRAAGDAPTADANAESENGEDLEREEDESTSREDDPPEDGPIGAFDPANVETPAYPSAAQYRIRDTFRLRVQSRFLPAASFDGFDADLYQPSLRFRATAPLSKRAVLQLTVRFAPSIYDFDGSTNFFGSGPSNADPFDDFFRTQLSLQGGFPINEHRGLFVEEEIWSVLGRAFVGSNWEDGAFGDGLTGGGSLALGYEIDDLIRVAVGVNIKSRIDRSGVKIGPILDLRWNVTDRFTVRNRGEGLQLEYALLPGLELFMAGFFDGQKFRLDSRPGLSDDLTFRDKSVQAGAGFEWRISKHFRLNFEAGAVAWREMRVRSHAMGTLSKERGDPSAYFDLRFELRP
jgi:hypothetical protein